MTCTWRDRVASYVEPVEPLLEAAREFVAALWQGLRDDGLGTFARLADVRDAAMASWFRAPSDDFRRFEARAGVPDLVAAASGVVLELGPGCGNQIGRYDRSNITAVYGVEPNRHFAVDVRRRVAAAGLEDRYRLVLCAAQDSRVLLAHGITPASVDTVLSVQVLCSVPAPAALAKELYRLLKPGGTLIFWEHGRSSDRLTAAVQGLWNGIWAAAIGGCRLNRDIASIVRAAGEWENPDSLQSDETPQSLLPRTWGKLVKKK